MAKDEETVIVKYHKVVASWTRALGIFTAVLAVVSGAQWYMMLSASQDTREFFLASQRPLVTSSDNGGLVIKHWDLAGGKAQSYTISHHLINSGNSSALVKKYSVDTCNSPCSPDAPHDLASNAIEFTDVIGAKSRYMLPASISTDDLLAASAGTKTVSVMMYLEYQDTFGSGRTYHLFYCDKILVKPGVDVTQPPPSGTKFDDMFENISCSRNNKSD